MNNLQRERTRAALLRDRSHLVPCPIPHCKRNAQTLNGLYTHLYHDHLKKDLITWILNRLQKDRHSHEDQTHV